MQKNRYKILVNFIILKLRIYVLKRLTEQKKQAPS